jgi:uncharacterized membrane protein
VEYVLLALLILAYLFVTPLAAWVSARRTRARVAVLEDTVVRQAQELAQLRARLQQQTRTSEDVAVAAVAREVTPPSVVPEPVEETKRQEPVGETAPAVEEAPVVATLPTPAPEAAIEPIAPPPELIPTVETPIDVEAPAIDAGVPAVAEAPQVAAREITQPPAALREDSGTAEVGSEGPRIPPPPPAPPSEPEPPSPGFDWEGLVGVKLFSAIAGIALVLAAIFFLRYSMEHGWLQPPIRVIIGVVIGVGLLVLCEFKAARRYPYTANALDAAAIAILFATFFAAHALWNLIPALATFVLLAIVTGVAVLLSIRRESLFIAVLGLLGGFSTPALLSTGENKPIPLFAYLMLLNVGLAWVAYRQGWPALTWLTLIFTTLYQWGWVWRFLHESSLSLAMGVFLVFPIVTVLGLMLSRRGVPDEGSPSTARHFERTATLSAALPLLFAAYVATIPAYGAQSALLFGFLLLIDLGLFAVAVARRQHVLHAGGAIGTLFVMAEWLSTSYAPGGSLTVPLFAAAFAVLYLIAPSVARWLERPLEGAAVQARYAAPVLLFVFPIIARIDPAFSSPLALFSVLLGLVVLIAWRAIATEDGPLYYVAAFFAIAAQASWSATHLTSARLGTAVAIYVVFGLVSIATPALARRVGKPLEPAWGSGAVLLVSLVLLLFLSLGPVTPAALWAMALLLAILNAGLFVESAYGGLPIVSQAGSLFSWLILASWWLRAAASIGVLPSLTVLAGLTLVTLGGHAWASMHAEHAPSARVERGFSQGLYLGVIGHLFLLFLALNREWALPPWPIFGTLAVITLATTVTSLVTRQAWLHGAGVIAAAIVVAGWAWAAGDPRWGLIAILASAAVTAYALAWIRPATARWAVGPTSIAAGAVLFVAEAAVLLAVYGGATPPFPALVIAHVVNISLILALTHLRRWKYVAILAVLPAWLAVGQFQVVDVRLLDWARLLEISGALYAVFIAYPIVLGQRVGGDRDPYLAAVLMSGIFLIASRVAFSIGNFDWAIGIVPVGEGAILALLLRSLLRMEPAGQRDTGRLVLVAGAALAFATVAIPLQLKQQWITIGWALEGAALAWLYRRVPHRGLLYFTAGLLGTVFVRLAMNPEILVYEPRGAMRIFNWYLYAYGICAVAMFVAAYSLSATEDRLVTGLPRLSQVLPAAGVILLFLLLNIEIADYYATGPTIAFRFGAAVSQDLTYTIAWLIFGMALLAVGIAMRNRAARLTAVILITITTLKCFLYDLSSLGGLYRVASFVGLALSLALVSLALQKFVLSKPKGTA